MTLDLIYVLPIFHERKHTATVFLGCYLALFFLGTTVSATAKMLTEQQPLQTTHSQLSLNRHLWNRHKEVSIVERCLVVYFTKVSINRVDCAFS